jgi:hypothetical protein
MASSWPASNVSVMIFALAPPKGFWLLKDLFLSVPHVALVGCEWVPLRGVFLFVCLYV